MTTPAWQAPLNGLPGNQRAALGSAHLNQLLGAHAVTQIGYGNPVMTPKAGDQGYFTRSDNVTTTDFAQAFTMSGTSIGRITVPVLPFGNGADLLLSLCPDSSGVPNTAAPIAQVKVPAAVITALGAQQGLEAASSPLQTPAFNTMFGTNFSPAVTWNSPAATVHGAPTFFAVATSGNYSILLGGYDTTASTPSAACFTAQYTGGGTVAAPVPQPPLPQATFEGQAAATPDTVIYAGGLLSTSTTAVTNVWAASWNPNTGVIGAWSAQPALPQGICNGAGASWGEFVYIVGGSTTQPASTTQSTVYMSKVANNQLGAWSAQAPLPRGVQTAFVGAIAGWLIVAGGMDSSGANRAECYYARIAADGSLGPWRTGPSLAQISNATSPNWCTGITPNSLIAYSGQTTGGANATYGQVLSVTTTGIAPVWNTFVADANGTTASSAFTDGPGIWYLMGYNINNTVQQNFFQAVPLVSAPLYASGLTSGAKYWLLMQHGPQASASDYLGFGLNFQAYPVDAQVSNRHKNAWSASLAGWSVPITVFDATLSQPVVHTVEDLTTGVQSAFYERWSTLTYNAQGLLAGAVEVTMQPNTPLNANPTFSSGVSPWTAANGTITQSSAQTHGGYAFSGLLTPTGGFAQASALSELFPVRQTPYGNSAWLLPTGWFYTPTTWTNFSLSVNWYDSSQTLISTSSANTSLTGATWTQISNYFQPPATAAYGQLAPTMSGSPASTNTLYMSYVPMLLAPEMVPAMASIAQVNYSSNTPWPPTGVTQLN